MYPPGFYPRGNPPAGQDEEEEDEQSSRERQLGDGLFDLLLDPLFWFFAILIGYILWALLAH